MKQLVTIVQCHSCQAPKVTQGQFGIPPANGETFLYHELARLLSPDQPVYGLRATGLDGKSQPLSRMEDIAAAYISEIRNVQPHGPYIIVGRCAGGPIAYEMAQQLSKSGEAIGLLCVIEPYELLPQSILPRLTGLVLHVLYHIPYHDRRKKMCKALIRFFVIRLRRLLARLSNVGNAIHRFRLHDSKPNVITRRDIHEAHVLAIQTYRAAQYPGRIVLFLAANEDNRSTTHLSGWRSLAPVELLQIPGDHYAITSSENLPILAHHLQRYLDEAFRRLGEP